MLCYSSSSSSNRSCLFVRAVLLIGSSSSSNKTIISSKRPTRLASSPYCRVFKTASFVYLFVRFVLPINFFTSLFIFLLVQTNCEPPPERQPTFFEPSPSCAAVRRKTGIQNFVYFFFYLTNIVCIFSRVFRSREAERGPIGRLAKIHLTFLCVCVFVQFVKEKKKNKSRVLCGASCNVRLNIFLLFSWGRVLYFSIFLLHTVPILFCGVVACGNKKIPDIVE